MEQGQCWMWTKRKHCESSNLTSQTSYYPSSYDDSWEEQAFAKDAAGSDCIWPPRSYSCSFCKREFRSAQALGGHMNVHRRDRARLKQPHSPQKEVLSLDLETHHDPHNISVQNSFTSLDYLSSLSGLAYTTNPNSDDPSHVFAPPSEVLATSVNKNCREKALIPLYNSSIFQGCLETSPAHSSKPLSNLAEDCRLYSSELDPEAGSEKILKGIDFGCRSEEDSDKTEVAVDSNLSACRAYTHVQFETKGTDKGFKKRKTYASCIPFFSKSNSVDKHDHLKSAMFEIRPGIIEELDLELRLGYRTKV